MGTLSLQSHPVPRIMPNCRLRVQTSLGRPSTEPRTRSAFSHGAVVPCGVAAVCVGEMDDAPGLVLLGALLIAGEALLSTRGGAGLR